MIMRTTFNMAVLAVLLVAASSPCFAFWSVGPVSKEQAKELGIEIRSKPSGPHAVWVELEFKPEGRLREFSHADLRISEGEKVLVRAALREDRSKPGRVAVSFTSDRAQLNKITLWLFVANMMPGGTIHELQVEDFLELAQRGDDYPDEISQQLFDLPWACTGKARGCVAGSAAGAGPGEKILPVGLLPFSSNP